MGHTPALFLLSASLLPALLDWAWLHSPECSHRMHCLPGLHCPLPPLSTAVPGAAVSATRRLSTATSPHAGAALQAPRPFPPGGRTLSPLAKNKPRRSCHGATDNGAALPARPLPCSRALLVKLAGPECRPRHPHAAMPCVRASCRRRGKPPPPVAALPMGSLRRGRSHPEALGCPAAPASPCRSSLPSQRRRSSLPSHTWRACRIRGVGPTAHQPASFCPPNVPTVCSPR